MISAVISVTGSSTIQAVEYDEAAQLLRVQFHGGSWYEYPGVTVFVFGAFIQAPSKGQFFHRIIRGMRPVPTEIDNPVLSQGN